jgi:hypothetical protein
MKNKTPEQRLYELGTLGLPDHVRISMREELSAYADLHSIPAHNSAEATTNIFSSGSRLWYTSAAMLLVILVTGSTTYAAEGTLPGDILYPIKTKISEPLQTALIPSAKGKAVWHSLLAERRLEEATTLAVANNLSEETEKVLTASFEEHVQYSLDGADTLADSGETTASLEVREDLEARLTAHADILGEVRKYRDESSTDEKQNKTVHTLLARLQEKQEQVREKRLHVEESLAVTLPSGAVSPTSTLEEPVDSQEIDLPVLSVRVQEAHEAVVAARNAKMQDAKKTEERDEEYRKTRDAVRATHVVNILREHKELLKSVQVKTNVDSSSSTTEEKLPEERAP